MSHGINFDSIMSLAVNAVSTYFTGGASLLASSAFSQVVGDAFSSAATSVLGDNAGSMASSAFNGAMNEGFSQLEGWGSNELGNATSQVLNIANHQGQNGAYTGDLDRAKADLQDTFANLIVNSAKDNAVDLDGPVQAKGGKNSWLMAMAIALGKQANSLANQMTNAANHLDGKDPKASAEFQTLSQQFGMMMNTISTAIKSIGDGLSTVARKQ